MYPFLKSLLTIEALDWIKLVGFLVLTTGFVLVAFKGSHHDREFKEIKQRLQALEDGSYVKEVRKSFGIKD